MPKFLKFKLITGLGKVGKSLEIETVQRKSPHQVVGIMVNENEATMFFRRGVGAVFENSLQFFTFLARLILMLMHSKLE